MHGMGAAAPLITRNSLMRHHGDRACRICHRNDRRGLAGWALCLAACETTGSPQNLLVRESAIPQDRYWEADLLGSPARKLRAIV